MQKFQGSIKTELEFPGVIKKEKIMQNFQAVKSTRLEQGRVIELTDNMFSFHSDN